MVSSVGNTVYSAAGDAHFVPKPKLKEFINSLSESDAKLLHHYLNEQLTAPLVRLELLLDEDKRDALLDRLRTEAKAKETVLSAPPPEDTEEEEEEEQEEN